MKTRNGRFYGILSLAGALALCASATVQAQDLFVSSLTTNSILRYNGTTGAFIGTFAAVSHPNPLAIGPDGNLYVGSDNRVLRYNTSTGALIDTFVPTGSGGLNGPTSLVFHGGFLYVASFGTQTIADGTVLRYNATTGAFVDTFVAANSATGTGVLTNPDRLLFAPDGSLLVGSANNTYDILRYDGNTGAYINRFDQGSPGGQVDDSGMVIGPDGNLYVADLTGVYRYNITTGNYLGTFIPTGSGGLGFPSSMEIGPDGNFYIGDTATNNVHRYNAVTGAFIDQFASGGGLNHPLGIAFETQAAPSTPEPGVVSLFAAMTLVAGTGFARRRRSKS